MGCLSLHLHSSEFFAEDFLGPDILGSLVPTSPKTQEYVMITPHLYSSFPCSDLCCLTHMCERIACCFLWKVRWDKYTNTWDVICSSEKLLPGPYLSHPTLHRLIFGGSYDSHPLPGHLELTVWTLLQPVYSGSSSSRVSVPGGSRTGVSMSIECWQQMRLTPLAGVCGFYFWFASPSFWKIQWWPQRH